jgi:hypothetical protein
VGLDDDPVGARGRRGQRQREREAVRALERADAALAEHHVGVALLEDVLRAHQQLLERRRQAALEQHRDARAPDLGEQRVVLHVARADLDDVRDLGHRLDVAHVHQLGDDRQPGLRLGLAQQPQALLAEALEGVRRGARLVRAAAIHRRAGGRHGVRGGEDLVARLDGARTGDQREVVAADLAPRDLQDAAPPAGDLRGGELVGLEDRDDVVDAVHRVGLDAGDVLAVADGADQRHLFAPRDVGAGADALYSLDDGRDLVVSRRLLHHDQHQKTSRAFNEGNELSARLAV